MKRIIFSILCLLPTLLNAQDFNVKAIPDSLIQNANAVVRLDEKIFEILSPGKAIEHQRHVYTIFDEEGDRHGRYASQYDKFTTISHINCTLYNSLGKEVKRIKRKDMEDRSSEGDGSLMTDARFLSYDFYNRNYPYTVDYEEEDEISGLFDLEGWMPQMEPYEAVQLSRYVLIAPSGYNVRFKARNFSGDPKITEEKGRKTYTWEIRNLKAKLSERFSPRWDEINPVLFLAPSDFEIQGYSGNMNSWLNFGKFYRELYKGRDVLPDETRKKVHELTDNLKDVNQKINVLYDYLQRNTRYISIQLGIGGWQPFDASFVATKKYGDCKALANFMVALLKEAGIKANTVAIMAEADAPPLMDDFPSHQFNHVIACVPLLKDTVWLECTSAYNPPGFMGSFTGNKKALLMDESGGYIVQTPVYTFKDNVQQRNIESTIDLKGALDARIYTVYSGTKVELPEELIHEASLDDRTKFLNRYLDLPTYSIESSKYEEKRSAMPQVFETLHILAPGYATVSGKRLFIEPYLIDKSNIRFSKDSIRLYDILIDEGYTKIDTITIRVPPNYLPEAMPKEVRLESQFGKYRCSTKIMDDRIIFLRYQEQYRGKYPAKEYLRMQDYYDQIYKADRSRVVLVKKE